MDNEPKHTVKATKVLLSAEKSYILQWQSQSPDLSPTEHDFQLLKAEKGSCSKGLAKRLTGSRLQAVIDCKGF